jgi:hypothetical protein
MSHHISDLKASVCILKDTPISYSFKVEIAEKQTQNLINDELNYNES